jgi:hypothetical protein
MKNASKMLLLSLYASMLYLLPLSAMAEDEPGPLAEMWMVTVKNGYLGNFQEALKEHSAFRAEHGDPWKWQVYASVVGKNLDQIAIRHCCVNWADVDSYEQWNRGNPEVTRHWFETVGPHVEKVEHYFEQIEWDESNWNAAAGSNRLFGVTEWTIKGGYAADFAASREKMSQIAINQGWATAGKNWLWAKTIGGRETQSIVIPYNNYAAMAPGEESFYAFLAKHLGSEEAAGELLKTFSSATWGSEYTVWEHRPDLSMGKDD